jgi:alpha-galactosidase
MRIPKLTITFLLILNLALVKAQVLDTVYRSMYNFHLSGDLKGFKVAFSTRNDGQGVQYLVIDLRSKTKIVPAMLSLRWNVPIVDIQGTWTPPRTFNKNLDPNWAGQILLSGATMNAPVTCFYNMDSQNRLTFACSEALNPVSIATGVNESTANMDCELKFFIGPQIPIDHYVLTLRIDTRDLPFSETIGNVGTWWQSMPAYQANSSPEPARLPMYSTWYSFHQNLDTRSVEAQCRLAKAMGCETVIEDDGWQTLDSNRGYSYTGDWMPDRIPDMRGHVARIHQAGMKFMLWYSVPFVGDKSRIYPQFKGKYLYYSKGWGAYALDPRFPEVREYLIHKYESALMDWDLDGFKLDFVDSFSSTENEMLPESAGMDIASINDAVDRLLTNVMSRLRAIKPDVMIEFRQSYVGPLMRKYGNMFRASDSPNDMLSNRIKTIDVRLLSGATAVHSDMLMWHPNEKAEVAALHLLNILFSVPQISVKLDSIPAAQRQMLQFWLGCWRDNRDVLLDGVFLPENPELNYPVVTALNNFKQVTVAYAPHVLIKIAGKLRSQVMLINASHKRGMVVALEQDAGIRMIEVLDCMGHRLKKQSIQMNKGLHEIDVPAAGIIRFNLRR